MNVLTGGDPETGLEPEIIRSRRVLIDVLIGLEAHREALTVLGAHAVIEVTRDVPAIPPADSTRDADLGVIPELLAESPHLADRMTELGYETARPERPGVWSPISQHGRGVHARDSIDLIAPMSLARGRTAGGRAIRAARVGAHGRHAVSATRGTELSLLDRRVIRLRSFDSGPGVDAYVAGPAALLCAKAHKLHDRMDPDELRRNADRLRPKDFADVYRLLLAGAPEDVAELFSQGIRDTRIGGAVAVGRDYLLGILDDQVNVAAMVADVWGDPSLESDIAETVGRWVEQFRVSGG